MSVQTQDALTDPFSVYPTPRAVVEDDSLATAGKLKVLNAMEQDLIARQVAEAENMPAAGASAAGSDDDEVGVRLSEVRAAVMNLNPSDEAHGDTADAAEAPIQRTTEQARQADVALKTNTQRILFLGMAGAGALIFLAVVLVMTS